MRVIVGLTPPTTGAAYVLGRRFTDLPNPGLDVGVLLDASAQHGGRMGREILTLAQKTMGLGAGRVDEMLDLVSLTETEEGRRVRDYSLGMRQRLGIAQALLGSRLSWMSRPTASTRPGSAGCATCCAFTYHLNVLADFEDPDSKVVGVEFAGTSISSGRDGGETDAGLEVRKQANPHLVKADLRRGYLRQDRPRPVDDAGVCHRHLTPTTARGRRTPW